MPSASLHKNRDTSQTIPKTKESIDLHRLLVIENHFSSYLSNKYGNNFRALSFSIASPNGSYNSLSYRS